MKKYFTLFFAAAFVAAMANWVLADNQGGAPYVPDENAVYWPNSMPYMGNCTSVKLIENGQMGVNTTKEPNGVIIVTSNSPTTGPCYQISFPAHYGVAVKVKRTDEIAKVVGSDGEEFCYYKDVGYYAYANVSSITVKGNNVMEITYDPGWADIELAKALYRAWIHLEDCMNNDAAVYEKYKPLYDEVKNTRIPDLVKEDQEGKIYSLLDVLTFDVKLSAQQTQHYIDLVNAAIVEIEKS